MCVGYSFHDSTGNDLSLIHIYAEAMAAKLEGVSLTIATKVSSTGTIFGSVSNIQIRCV